MNFAVKWDKKECNLDKWTDIVICALLLLLANGIMQSRAENFFS